MKENMLEYKGYHTSVNFYAEEGVLRGVIEGITDFVDFQATSIPDVEKEFHNAVDDYLAFCEEVGKAPEKEYKGTFNVRIKPELHKKIAIKALENGETLNSAVERAISLYVSEHYVDKLMNRINNSTRMIYENAIKESRISDTGKYAITNINHSTWQSPLSMEVATPHKQITYFAEGALHE